MSEARPRLKPQDVIISPVTEDDVRGLAEGYYAAFDETWHLKCEPHDIRKPDEERVRLLAKRFSPWLLEPDMVWRKVALVEDPKRMIAHAGWATPERKPLFNLWRRDSVEELGHAEKMGWTQRDVDEMWEGFDADAWQAVFRPTDVVRREVMQDEKHWYLAPVWVLPEYQGRGLASLLIREVVDVTDKQDPPTPIYLEALPDARPVYEHLGFKGLEGKGREAAMVRRGPGN